MLVCVRVGENTGSRDGLFVGQSDYPLTDDAPALVRETTSVLTGYVFANTFASDLTRSQQMLDVLKTITVLGQITLVEELRERSFGDYEGKSEKDVRAALPPREYKLWNRDYRKAPKNGETLADVGARVALYYEIEIKPILTRNENVLIVSHEAPIKALLGHISGATEEQICETRIERAVPYFFYSMF